MLHHTVDGAPTVRRVYSASPCRLLESEIRSFSNAPAPPELVQRDVTAWWKGIPVSVAFDEDTITLHGFADTAWLEATSVLPLDDRDEWFSIRILDLTALSGLRAVTSTSSWADESGEFGPYAVTGERLADFDPHPSGDLREVAWTRSGVGEHVGAVEWRRALGYFRNEPVDVLASNGEQLWVTVPETSPLVARGRRIVDAPFTDLYRGRTAFWVPRHDVTSERTAPGTVRVDGAEVELAEPYSAWNGSDRLRVYPQDALEAIAPDGFDRETSHVEGRQIATIRSFEIEY